jgi:hypothetical protein
VVENKISTPPPPLTGEWTKQQLTDKFWAEGACVGDVNKDGKNDVLCGPYWYEGPDFKKTHVIYEAKRTFKYKKADGTEVKHEGFAGVLSGVDAPPAKNGGPGGINEYSNNFVTYTYDFNADGYLDYLVVGFPGAETFWYENPQGKDELWQRHTALKVTDNESPMFVDVDGDKIPDLLCMSGGNIGFAKFDPKSPTAEWKWMPVSENLRFQRFTHGIGYGDINGDGKTDLIESTGWWEQPANWDGKTPWTKHNALFGKGGSQQYGYDVNGDGKTDVITAIEAHGWGISWFEQTNVDGAMGWTEHTITGGGKSRKSKDSTVTGESGVNFSQPHAVDLADMNGDGVMDLVSGKRVWAHGPGNDAEASAPGVLWWFELKREGGKAKYIPHIIDDNSGVGTQVLAVDINGDKKLDVVVGNKRGAFVHLRK